MLLTRMLLKLPRLFVGAQRVTMPRGFRPDRVLREEDFASHVRIGGMEPVQEFIEHLRVLYLALIEQVGPDGCVALCSPNPREGRSLVTANLAVAMAHDTGHPVTVVDLSFRDGAQARLLDVEPTAGFADLRPGERSIRVRVPTDHPDLELVQPGDPGGDGTRLLQSGRLDDLFRELKAAGRFVLVDTPPATAGVDARIIAERVDGVVTVVRLGKTKRSDLAPYYRAFRDLPLLGVACNGHERWLPAWLQRFL